MGAGENQRSKREKLPEIPAEKRGEMDISENSEMGTRRKSKLWREVYLDNAVKSYYSVPVKYYVYKERAE